MLLDTKQTALRLGVSEDTLRQWRSRSRPDAPVGPPWVRIEGLVRYEVEALDAWVAARRQGGSNVVA